MMKKQRILSLLAGLLCLLLILCACGKTEPEVVPAEEPELSPSPEPIVVVTEDLRSLEGVYTEEIAHRGVLVMTASDELNASFVIDWANSAASSYHWEMHGVYDAQKQAVVYSDAVLIDKVFDEAGRENDTVLYTQGTGSFRFADGKLVWTEDGGNRSEPSTFVFEMTLEQYRQSQQPVPIVSPSPSPTATPVPTQAPIVRKDPTAETVKEGESCIFIAEHEHATIAVWHFLSPDGKIDMEYSAAEAQFPPLQVVNGMYSTMTLKNVPATLNGWRVYCRYSNDYGSVDTKAAVITVLPAPTPTPAPTPAPTAEPSPGFGPVVNDWVETGDLQEAVNGSGVSFTPPVQQAVPEGLKLKTYRYRTGTIEARYVDEKDENEVVLTIRKSTTDAGADLLGDFNSYSQTWDLTLKGLVLHCQGDGSTANTAWFDSGDKHFGILFNQGKEGKGLTPDQLNSLVNGMQ